MYVRTHYSVVCFVFVWTSSIDHMYCSITLNHFNEFQANNRQCTIVLQWFSCLKCCIVYWHVAFKLFWWMWKWWPRLISICIPFKCIHRLNSNTRSRSIEFRINGFDFIYWFQRDSTDFWLLFEMDCFSIIIAHWNRHQGCALLPPLCILFPLNFVRMKKHIHAF